ncbi:thiol:disulfide interchange protein DsbA precursor [Ferrovum sp. JA12]|uniref:thiol:disulfide interchange protein DsbA/DsbL n=1 Tax=Ferrovum sp. JA12 TaxID=1356299 RepID=UPI0007037871|nr:thiol:disulfide interchange protein DsbA/DsbL [Ferrovum sp. JA12]KRH79377.1 thiol:disulfide interchange protein DsbA precursor [Ferrovum sp. JA12]
MKKLINILFCSLSFFALISLAHAAPPVKGKDYVVIDSPVPAESSQLIEVDEVFSYACPHCAHFAPTIEAWAKTLPKNVVFKRIPVSFGRSQWAVTAKTYYAINALHLVGQLHERIFKAIHEENINLFSEDELFDWIQKQGVNRQQFINIYRSFSVQSELQRGDQLAMSYGVDAVPTLIINGEYRTSPSMVGGYAQMIPVLNDLVAISLKKKHP